MWCNHNWEYDKSNTCGSTTEIQFVCTKCNKTKLIKIEKELLRVDFTKNIIQTKNYINKKNRLILDDELFLAKQ